MFKKDTIKNLFRKIFLIENPVLKDRSPELILLLSFTFFLFYFIVWHITVILFTLDFSWKNFGFHFWASVLIYSLISIILTLLFLWIFSRSEKPSLRYKIVNIALLFLFIFFALIRIVDWGTLYFAGQHINNEFWYHAFYVDGTTFLATKISVFLFISVIVFTGLFYRVLKLIGFFSKYLRTGISEPSLRSILIRNSVLPVFIIMLSALLMLALAGKKDENRTEKIFAGIPEAKALSSFIDYAFLPEPSIDTELPADLSAKLKSCGIIVNSIDKKFPLIKKSIYLNAKNRNPGKPGIKKNTNIVIVFSESLSKFFLDEEIHGYRGLTPNLHGMIHEGYYFTRMYNSTFPTIRGIVATLGSSLYMIEKLQGTQKGQGMRPPIICKFLLLSDILKPYGYSATHVQGGGGLFAGIESAFINRQNYDGFYGWESLEMQAYANRKLNSQWGLRDEDVFRFAVSS